MSVMSEMDLNRQAIQNLDGIGHNNPPNPIDYARDTINDLGRFLADTPVIETGKQAQDGALFVERTRKTLQDMEDARKAEVSPLNDEVKSINERYKSARSPLETILNELRHRLTDFAAREEAKRNREAEEARKLAELAEMEARVAEQRERDAKAGATVGEITDVAAAVVEADTRFADYQRADRAALVAQRNTGVRLASQLGGRALSMRSKETLTVDNALKAVAEIGSHPKINEAILVAAREYRRQYGKLPAGVSATTTREI